MAGTDFDPLFGEPRAEVPLTNAPLVRVLAQVQFTPILRIRVGDFIPLFQDMIRSDYPTIGQEQVQSLSLTGSEAQIQAETIWRFFSADGTWRITLTTTFIALEAQKYRSRDDFMARLKGVLEAFLKTVGSARMTRVGVRYVDHVRSPEVEAMADMLRPEMLGVTTAALRRNLRHSFNEALWEVAEGQLLARWGLLPPNGTHDPDVMPPSPEISWFLDLDVFKQYGEPFEEMDADRVHQVADELAVRSYAFFRWATTDRFLKAYGGQA